MKFHYHLSGFSYFDYFFYNHIKKKEKNTHFSSELGYQLNFLTNNFVNVSIKSTSFILMHNAI